MCIRDRSTGAWQQVFKLRPDWPGKVIADLNFELPAYAHNAWDAIRSTYEYEDFLKEFVEKLPVDPTNVDVYKRQVQSLSKTSGPGDQGHFISSVQKIPDHQTLVYEIKILSPYFGKIIISNGKSFFHKGPPPFLGIV